MHLITIQNISFRNRNPFDNNTKFHPLTLFSIRRRAAARSDGQRGVAMGGGQQPASDRWVVAGVAATIGGRLLGVAAVVGGGPQGAEANGWLWRAVGGEGER